MFLSFIRLFGLIELSLVINTLQKYVLSYFLMTTEGFNVLNNSYNLPWRAIITYLINAQIIFTITSLIILSAP